MISETSFGHKAANLLKLDHLCKSLTLPKLSLCVPKFICFSHTEILEHIEKFYPTYSKDWNTFLQMHNLSSDAQLHLWKIQENLIHVFSKHHFCTHALNAFLQDEDILIVRSTGREDSRLFSNAGGNRSESGILPQIPLVSEAIGKVVASYHSIKSLRLRSLGEDNIEAPPFLSVFVQEMIGEIYESNRQITIPVSGILHTQEMMGHTPGVIQVQALFGHNDGLVKNILPFDTFYVQPETIHEICQFKKQRLVPSLTGEFIRVDNPWELRISPTLNSQTLFAFHELSRHVEDYFKFPMEMEWVFVDQVLYLVQARPLIEKKGGIPTYVDQKVLNSIPHEEYPIEAVVSKGSVTVLSDPKEWIQDVTLEKAFNHYLREDKPALKAMLSQFPAAATSHAACSLREKGIEVFSGINLNLHKKRALLDPQQGKVFVLTEELFDQKMIVEGWTSHPISPVESIPRSKIIDRIVSKVPETFEASKVQRLLIEAAHSNAAVDELLNILDFETQKLESFPVFFERAYLLRTHAHQISKLIFSKIPHMQRLHILKRLEALFFQKKSADVLRSDSLKEILREQNTLFDQEKYILTPQGKSIWNSFTEGLLHDSPEILKRLETLIGEIQQLHVMEEWINLALANLRLEQSPEEQFLRLDAEFKEHYAVIHYVSDSRKILKQWQERLVLWADPNRFDSLYMEFTHQFFRDLLESTHLFFTSSNWLVRAMLIRFVQEAVEVYDVAIKTLKGSSAYSDKSLQVIHFKQMLQPLFLLMKKWIEHIPDEKILEWVKSIESFGDKIPGDYRQTVIEAISRKMEEIRFTSQTQLWPSNDFNVSALIISSAYYKNQELPKCTTLEDLCTLIHQNIIAAQITHLTSLWEKFLPPAVLALHKKITEIKKECVIRPGVRASIHANWTGVSYVYPLYTIFYNVPVKNHSTVIHFTYDLNERRASVLVRMIGHNRGGRMDHISGNIYLQSLIQKCHLSILPAYDPQIKMLEFQWELNEEELHTESYLSALEEILVSALEETLLEKGREIRLEHDRLKILWESQDKAQQWFQTGAPYFCKMAQEILNQEDLVKILVHLGGSPSKDLFFTLVSLLKSVPAYFRAYGDDKNFYGLNEFSDWALRHFFAQPKEHLRLIENREQFIYPTNESYDTKMFYLALQIAIFKGLKEKERESFIRFLIDHHQTETIFDLHYSGFFKFPQEILQEANVDGYPIAQERIKTAKSITEMTELNKGDQAIVQVPHSKLWLKTTVIKANPSDSVAEPFGNVKLRLARGRVVKVIDPFKIKKLNP